MEMSHKDQKQSRNTTLKQSARKAKYKSNEEQETKIRTYQRGDTWRHWKRHDMGRQSSRACLEPEDTQW